jgi:hypothetical protein
MTVCGWFVFITLIGGPLICVVVILFLAYLKKIGVYHGE